MTSSVLDSIKVAFGGNIDNNIEFFNEKNEENISLSSLFYFSLALNLENLLFGGQEWEKKRKNLLSINADNNEEIFAKLYEVKDNSKFQILELSDEIILDFKDFFESKDFEFIGKYFEVNVDVLNNVFVKKDSYSFAIIFVIFQELIKNMFKYGSTKTNNDVIFKIIANNNEKIELIFENSFLNSKTKNKIGTLKGLKMIEMFAKVLGGFKDNSNDEMFSIKIEIDNKFFEKE
jgi:two-component sensor histidine kinase